MIIFSLASEKLLANDTKFKTPITVEQVPFPLNQFHIDFSLSDNLKVLTTNALDGLKIANSTLVIPKGVKMIEANALSGLSFASGAGQIHFEQPSELEIIQPNAFANITGLDSIAQIPSSVNNIGVNAFSGNSNLSSITFGDNTVKLYVKQLLTTR